jgi:hypothetical protein
MRLVNNNRVVLAVEDDYVIIMAKGDNPSVFDPTGTTYWGLAQGFKVVRDTFSKTLVLVPLGEPSKVRFDEFRPEDLETE